MIFDNSITARATLRVAAFTLLVVSAGRGVAILDAVSASIAFDNSWHHVVWAQDDRDARLYIDVELLPVVSADGTRLTAAAPSWEDTWRLLAPPLDESTATDVNVIDPLATTEMMILGNGFRDRTMFSRRRTGADPKPTRDATRPHARG